MGMDFLFWEEFFQFLFHLTAFVKFVVEPDKCDVCVFVFGQKEQLFVLPESLTNLSFHTVPIDGMLEMPLGHAHENACRRLVLRAIFLYIDGSDGKGHDAPAFVEERSDVG